MDDKPGFVTLPLKVNDDDFDYDDVASYQFQIQLQQLDEKIHRMERNAIRNFLGYLAACIGWYVASIAFFNDVLNDDRNNLNALANLKWVYEELDCKHQAKEVAQRIEYLQLVLNENGDRGKVMKARCLAEKGYAVCHYVSNENEEEFIQACKMYDRAIEMAGHLVSNGEKVDWYLGRVRAKQVLLSKQTHWGKPREDVEFEAQLISDIQEVLRHGDNIMKAEAWVKLASVFRLLHRNSKLVGNGAGYPECLRQKHELIQMYHTPRAPVVCYNKALEYRPHNPQILAKKAKALKVIFYETREDYQTAFDLLDESIRADSSVCNRVAFSVQGEAYMDLYRYNRRPNGNRTAESENWSLLIEAKAAYEMSLFMHREPADCRQLGDVWRYLAHEHTQHNDIILHIVGKNKIQCLEKALEYYTIATEMPDGSINPHAHWKRGQCLLELKNPGEAAESFKRAIRCYKYPCYDMKKTYGRLFEAHLRMLHPI